MPEGPSIVILREAIEALNIKGKKIDFAEGNNSTINTDRLIDQEVLDFRSWGKNFLICFENFTLRIHFMLFGSYLINEQKKTPPRLSLEIGNHVLNFYACSVKIIEEPVHTLYDHEADIMSDSWNAEKALNKLQAAPKMFVCDALLDQNIFSGSGNIIKNEVLFRIRLHPISTMEEIPESKLKEMIEETRKYSFDFLEWKKENTLKKHWLAHTKKICPRCVLPFVKEYLGKSKRRSYFCTNCQILYGELPAKKIKSVLMN
jgi:endonuclease-8